METEAANQPVFELNSPQGVPAIRFENKDRGLQGSFTRDNGDALTILIVGQYDDGYTDRCMFEFRGPSDARAFFIDRRYAANTYYSPALTKGSFQLWVIQNEGSSAKVSEGDTTLMMGPLTLILISSVLAIMFWVMTLREAIVNMDISARF